MKRFDFLRIGVLSDFFPLTLVRVESVLLSRSSECFEYFASSGFKSLLKHIDLT